MGIGEDILDKIKESLPALVLESISTPEPPNILVNVRKTIGRVEKYKQGTEGIQASRLHKALNKTFQGNPGAAGLKGVSDLAAFVGDFDKNFGELMEAAKAAAIMRQESKLTKLYFLGRKGYKALRKLPVRLLKLPLGLIPDIPAVKDIAEKAIDMAAEAVVESQKKLKHAYYDGFSGALTVYDLRKVSKWKAKNLPDLLEDFNGKMLRLKEAHLYLNQRLGVLETAGNSGDAALYMEKLDKALYSLCNANVATAELTIVGAQIQAIVTVINETYVQSMQKHLAAIEASLKQETEKVCTNAVAPAAGGAAAAPAAQTTP